MKLLARSLFACTALAGLLSACGGGVTIGDFDDDDPYAFNQPRSSGRGASVTVSAATEPAFNGVYAAGDVWTTSVLRFDTCRFRFIGLQREGGGTERVMDGEVRYDAGSDEVRTTFVVINTLEFRADGSAGATVDRTNNQVTYSNVVFRSTQGTGQSLTLTGSFPMRNEPKPFGC